MSSAGRRTPRHRAEQMRPATTSQHDALSRRSVLVIATRNPGKLREYAALFADSPVVLRDLAGFPAAPEVAEDHTTYLGNARDKALSLARFTGLPALADDSGLEVDALDGEPGVRSARYAGNGATDHDNVALLLERLRGVPVERRQARFRCVIVVAQPSGALLTSEGTCEGWITTEPRGCAGFGYDPVFYFPPAGRTFAEMEPDEKNRVSHRASACERLAPLLSAFLRRSITGGSRQSRSGT